MLDLAIIFEFILIMAANALAKPVNLSSDLEAIVGKGPMPRTQVTKNLWAYIKKNGLQDQQNKRNINADAALKKIFGKDSANMFEMTKLVSKHITSIGGSSAAKAA